MRPSRTRRRADAPRALSIPVALSVLLSSAVAAAEDRGTLEWFHGPDDTSGMSLKALRIALDGQDLSAPVPAAVADPGTPLFSRPLAAGVHRLEVEASLEGRSALFRYMDGYRVTMRSRLEVEVLAGEGIAIRSRVVPKGGLSAPWAERSRLVLTLTAREAPAPGVASPAPAEAIVPPPPPLAGAEAAPGPTSTPEEPASVPPDPPAAPAIAAGEPLPTEAPPTAAEAAPRPAEPPAATSGTEPASGVSRPVATASGTPGRERTPAERAPIVQPPNPLGEVGGVPAPSEPSSPPPEPPAPAPARPRSPPEVPARAPVGSAAPERVALAPRAPPNSDAIGPCEVEPLAFEFDRAALSETARASLDRLAACLTASSSLRVRVEGHADARGSEEYNRWLAWDRAAAASAYLRAKGLAHRRVVTRLVGSARPLCGDATEECFARNRRVELVPFE